MHSGFPVLGVSGSGFLVKNFTVRGCRFVFSDSGFHGSVYRFRGLMFSLFRVQGSWFSWCGVSRFGISGFAFRFFGVSHFGVSRSRFRVFGVSR